MTLLNKYIGKKANRKAGLITAAVLFCSFTLARPAWSATDKTRWQLVKFLDKHRIYTVQDYAKWLSNNIHYEPDGEKDRWTAPLDTIAKRSGDCEDFAFLSADVLKIFGYQPYVLAVGKDKEAHVICVFKLNHTYYAFDNNQLNNTNQATLEKMAYFLAKKRNAEFVAEISLKPKTIKPLYIFHEPDQFKRFQGVSISLP